VGSPITFSGFNSIDWSLILNAVMEQERQPVKALETQKTTIQTQNTSLGTLLTKLNTLDAAVARLSESNSITPSSATSSSAHVSVSAGSAATPGTYDVLVTQLARAQVIASSSTYSSVNDVVATSGTLTISPATGDPVEISISADTTLAGLAAAINAASDSPVSAAVVQSTPGSYQLVLTGKGTGSANAFTLTSTLSGGAGVSFVDTDADNVYGDSAADLVRSAQDAQLTVNGLPVQASSNIVTDVIPGATLTLKAASPTETATVTVARDDNEAASRLQSFISAYNDIVQFMQDQDTAALAGRASLARYPLLRSFKDAVRAVVQDAYPEGNTFTQLAQIGVGFDRTGKMTLNRTVFDAAMASSSSNVQSLLSGTGGTGGVFGALDDTINEYTQTGGLVAQARDRMTQQVKDLTARLDTFDEHLSVRRAALQKQFQEAERLMSQLSAQGNSLSQLGAQYRSIF
jgi:flagellar hook-associated protein 2